MNVAIHVMIDIPEVEVVPIRHVDALEADLDPIGAVHDLDRRLGLVVVPSHPEALAHVLRLQLQNALDVLPAAHRVLLLVILHEAIVRPPIVHAVLVPIEAEVLIKGTICPSMRTERFQL